MPSFDVVSEVDDVGIRHATDNTVRELDTRWDFRNVEASVEYIKGDVTLKAEADFQCRQLLDMLRSNLVKQGVDPNAIDESENILHSGKTFSIKVRFRQGIATDVAKKIVKLLKENKCKVQAAIQGDKVRVSGKNRDDLQAAIALIKQAELDQPFQFNNFRD